MWMVFFSLMICMAAIVVLCRVRPNLFAFRLIEAIFDRKNYVRK